jgi:hypothetical protein
VQNFIYALIQVIHNFGAVTVVATGATALWLVAGNAAVKHRLILLLAWAWGIQLASGMLFGMTTFWFESHLPDIHGIAVDALLIKIFCALAGFILAISYVKLQAGWTTGKQRLAWRTSFALGLVALSSAAFLRWFS